VEHLHHIELASHPLVFEEVEPGSAA
jgi:hypothetical protein